MTAGSWAKKIILSLIGTVLIGLGASMLKLASFGNDPASALEYSLGDLWALTGNHFIVENAVSFGVITMNVLMFIPMFICQRNKIHVGTAINVFGMTFIIAFFDFLWRLGSLSTDSLPFYGRILFMLGGLVVQSFGVALFVQADFGIGPYDAMNLIFGKKFGYLWGRILTDVLSSVLALVIAALVFMPYSSFADFATETFNSDHTVVSFFTLILMVVQGPLITLFGKILKKIMFKGQETNI